MIIYKITPLFQPDWNNLFTALFPGREHSYSEIGEGYAKFGFDDTSVVPANLGPLVKVELISA